MKKSLLAAVSSAVLFVSMPVQAEELTGDAKLACEAILCLSTSTRPTECNESLRRYFSIKHKKAHKTARARRDFLKQCPRDQGGDAAVERLVERRMP